MGDIQTELDELSLEEDRITREYSTAIIARDAMACKRLRIELAEVRRKIPQVLTRLCITPQNESEVMMDLDVDTIETKKPSALAVVVGGLTWLIFFALAGIGLVELVWKVMGW